MTVGEFCMREVVITDRESSITEVSKLMGKFHVGDVVVVEKKGEQNIPVGIITDRDIVLQVIAKGIEADAVTAGERTYGATTLKFSVGQMLVQPNFPTPISASTIKVKMATRMRPILSALISPNATPARVSPLGAQEFCGSLGSPLLAVP